MDIERHGRGATISGMGTPQSDRLKHAREKSGFKRAVHFADAIGVPQPTYAKHEKGTRGFDVEQAEEYARSLGNCTAAWLLTGEGSGPDFDNNVRPAKLQQTTVVGSVQAGAWVEALDWPPEDQYPIMTPTNGFDVNDLMALEVRGSSMNRELPEGSIVVCVSLPALGRDPKEDELVVCQRTDETGLFEATVKRLKRDKEGVWWLWPDSDDPMHQGPISTQPAHGETLEIRGVVIW